MCTTVGEPLYLHVADTLQFSWGLNTIEIKAMHASMSVATVQKLFISHTDGKLQQQARQETGKNADLATVRKRPGVSGIGILIPHSPTHSWYLCCSHSLRMIELTGDNRLLVLMIKDIKGSIASIAKHSIAKPCFVKRYCKLLAYSWLISIWEGQ